MQRSFAILVAVCLSAGSPLVAAGAAGPVGGPDLFPACAGATSGRFAPGGRLARREFPISPTFSTSGPPSGSLEERRRRTDMGAAVPERKHGERGLDRDRAFEPEDPLRRNGPGRDALRPGFGRRRVPVRRRRPHVAPPWPFRDSRDRPHRRRSPESGCRARRGDGPHFRPESGARRLSNRRRRKDVGENFVPRREHRRGRSRGRSGGPVDRVCGALAGAQFSLAFLLPAQRGAGERSLQVAGRRQNVETALRERLAAGRRPRPDRARGRARRTCLRGRGRPGYLRKRRPLARRGDAKRSVPFRRRRRLLDASERRALGRKRLFRTRDRGPSGSRHGLHDGPVDPPLERRRQDLDGSKERRAATTITFSASIPSIRIIGSPRRIRARSSVSMRGKPGAAGTTSRRASSTISVPTIGSPTGSTAASRTAAA